MGYEAQVLQSYNVGSVTGGDLVGAIHGYDYDGSSNCLNCYCLEGCTEGQHLGATVLSAAQMTDPSNYEEFDFENVWTMDGNPDYPYPELIDNPHLTIEDEEPIIPGDVDGSGTVNVSDAIMALRASMGLLELTNDQFTAADMDGSNTVTVSDAIMILRTAMGLV